MESSSPSGSTSEPHSYSWAGVFGTIIAVLTLTLPVFFIANFSSSSVEPLPRPPYSIPRR